MMYIVEPTTIGAASCPRSTPVENVAIGRRFFTFPELISVKPLKRVDAKSFAGRTHWPSSAGSSAVPVVGAPPVCAAVLPDERDGSGLHARIAMSADATREMSDFLALRPVC